MQRLVQCACSLSFPLRVKQLYGVDKVYVGFLCAELGVLVGGSKWLLKDKPADTN